MSRRTFLVVAAAVLAAPTAPAQTPNPWRGTDAAAVAKPVEFKIELSFHFAPRGPVANVAKKEAVILSSCCETERCAPVVVAPRPRVVRMPDVPLVVCEFGTAAAVDAAPAAGKPSGTWYRELPNAVAAFTFQGDEVKAVMTYRVGETAVAVTLTAEYAVAKDGTLHGVVTGADVDVTPVPVSTGLDVAALAHSLQAQADQMVDQPFAVRCRPTEGGLMVSNVRVPGALNPFAIGSLAGKYKPAGTGPVPAPKPAAMAVSMAYPSQRCVPWTYDAPQSCIEYLAPAGSAFPAAYRVGVTYPVPTTPAVAPCPLPVEYRTPAVRPNLPPPPPEVLDVMVGTFGQMLGNPPVPNTAPVMPSAYSVPPTIPQPTDIPQRIMPLPQPLPIPAASR